MPDDIEAKSSQQLFEIEIANDEGCERTGQATQYSKNTASGSKQTGMIFRLRHLNTGRLVTM